MDSARSTLSNSRLIGKTRRTSGFSLLEMVLSMAFLLVIIGGGYTVFMVANIGFSNQINHSALNNSGSNLQQRLRDEIMRADVSTITPSVMIDSKTITFQPVINYTSGSPVLGSATTIQFSLATGETDNGVDDNGDGRIDEGVVRFSNQTGVWSEVGSDIKNFELNSITDGISYSYDVEIVDAEGYLKTITYSGKIYLRN